MPTKYETQKKFEVSEDLIHNFLTDLRKKDINIFERAKLIKEYKDHKGVSRRQLAKQLDIPHPTLVKWENWASIDKVKYEELKLKGFSDRDIYLKLFTNKGKGASPVNFKTKLDLDLKRVNQIIVSHIKEPVTSEDTIKYLEELRNSLNRLEMNIEKRQNGKNK